MIRIVNIDGEEMIAVILGDKFSVEIEDYRKAILNIFELSTLFPHFDTCVTGIEVWTMLKLIRAIGLPSEEKGCEI